jgi:tRNA/tmRNA/rRNA uracil-C5-methylase (TrmA/RlmC/RlmD family)
MFEGDILSSNINEEFLGPHITIDNSQVQQQYKDSINGQAFSMTASKIHQNYTKKSLKLKQAVLEPGKYKVEAYCGAKLLFSIEVTC